MMEASPFSIQYNTKNKHVTSVKTSTSQNINTYTYVHFMCKTISDFP